MALKSKLETLQGGGETTSVQKRDAKLTPGQYIVRIDGVTHEQGAKNGAFVYVKMTTLGFVEEVDGHEEIPKVHMVGHPTKVGREVTYKMWESSPSFGRDVVTFIVMLTGIDDTDVNPDYLQQMVSEKQPMAGYIARVECQHIYRKAEYKDPETKAELKEGAVGYTKCYFWESIDDEEQLVKLIGQEAFDEYVAVEEEGDE